MPRISEEKRKEKLRQEALKAYLSGYGVEESQQAGAAGRADNEIRSITLPIAEILSRSDQGTIVDLGCGQGPLLNRILSLEQFKKGHGWFYVGTDFTQHRDLFLKMGDDLGMRRRTDFVPLDDFNANWLDAATFPRPHLVLCRNVFHELDIEKTAFLINHVAWHLQDGERFIIQDLAVFPKAERKNACWTYSGMRTLLEQAGFAITTGSDEESGKGNRWFNVIGTRSSQAASSLVTVQRNVIDCRTRQWTKWREIGALHPDDETLRGLMLAKVDFDLQFVALTLQLLEMDAPDVTPLTPAQEKVALRETFFNSLKNYRGLEDPPPVIDKVAHFVNRSQGQKHLQKFLTDNAAAITVYGPPLIGKSELVKTVLATFAQSRTVLFLDIKVTSSVWNLLEDLFLAMVCRIPNELLTGLKRLKFNHVEDLLRSFFGQLGSRMIVVIDHGERMLDPNGVVVDGEIRQLIHCLAASGAKIILTSRIEPRLDFLPSEFNYFDHFLVKLLPKDEHIEHILKVFAGLERFPEVLIEAISRHPDLAVLVGLVLKQRLIQHKSIDFETDEGQDLLEEIRNRLRDKLLSRIADDHSKRVVPIFALLRIPIPRQMVVALTDETSVRHAEVQGLIFPERERDYPGEVVTCLGALKGISISADSVFSTTDDEEEDNDHESEVSTSGQRDETAVLHKRIAAQFERIYEDDKNPKWFRETVYHHLKSGDRDSWRRLGSAFRSELIGNAWYWFKKHQYDEALAAYQMAVELGARDIDVETQIASCLIRSNKFEEGVREFENIILRFPHDKRIKGFFIDTLLFVRQFDLALQKLQEYNWQPSQHPRNAVLFGRTYLGLLKYRKALNAFRITLQHNPRPRDYQNIAQAHHGLGDSELERDILEKGLLQFPDHPSLNLAYGALLERASDLDKALKVLRRFYKYDQYNAWGVFPLIRVLHRLNLDREAASVWGHVKGKLRPMFMETRIWGEILVNKNQFEAAIDYVSRYGEGDIHSDGFILESYVKWARQAEGEQSVEIARKGLTRISASDQLPGNIPFLVSAADLALLAHDRTMFDRLLDRMDGINRNLEAITRLRKEAVLAFA
ncbi:MAG: tetratricopeptide repeat protein [Magnetococcales bacterium]|nr:tetratricopeptide repeat protein [Magnetococcales bacterium]